MVRLLRDDLDLNDSVQYIAITVLAVTVLMQSVQLSQQQKELDTSTELVKKLANIHINQLNRSTNNMKDTINAESNTTNNTILLKPVETNSTGKEKYILLDEESRQKIQEAINYITRQ